MHSELIERPQYLSQLKALHNNGTVKILLGPRRCGKTTLLGAVKQWLLDSGVSGDRILSFDLGTLAQAEFLNSEYLIQKVAASCPPGSKTYVFIREMSESSNATGLAEALSRLPDVEVYASASNRSAFKDLNSQALSIINVYPLSFAEFRSAVASDGLSAREDFSRFVELGTYPALVAHRDDESFIKPYYELLVESLMYREVGLRFRLKNPLSLRRVVAYLVATAGSAVSARSVARILALAAGQTDLSDITVGRYLQALTDCGMFVAADRYDIKASHVMPGISKYYLADPSMSPYLTAMIPPSAAQLLENIVFLELKRRYAEVYAGKTATSEINFVCRGKNSGCYIQVAATGSPAQKMRVFRPLRDHYPCYVLTLDQTELPENTNGVRVLCAIDWLLESPWQL